jgi:hypothetical protein
MIGQGRGLHWPDLDEDISVENLLAENDRSRASGHLRNGFSKGPRGWEGPNQPEHHQSTN